MAFVHGKDVTIQVGATALTGQVVDASLDLRTALAELSLIGESAVKRVAGLEDATITINGPADSTTLEALIGYQKAQSPVTVQITFDTTTFSLSALIESISVNLSSTDAVRFTANLSATGEVTVS